MSFVFLWRRVCPGRNPLARITDRIEAAILIGGVLAALLGVPLAAAAGSEVYATMMARSDFETATRHATNAVLLEDAPPARVGVDGTPSAETARVRARWELSDGTFQDGLATADLGASAGDGVTVWLDESDAVVAPPVMPLDAASTGIGVGVGVWLVGVTLLASGYLFALRLLNRARRAAWDREWERLGQDWTPS
ncbi:Rv1733c family protein [Amycolatopsis thailandensis]|uniref:Rv1733c family protein n=1 Tax=Amycolatopsis thailandensis TaxID=589330 RepID=UPI0036367CA5